MLHPQIFAASFLFLIGHALAEYKMPNFNIILSLLGLSITFIGIFFWYMAMGSSYYENIKFIPYLITAIIATWSLKSLLERWKGQPQCFQKLLALAGKNTISILAFHLLSFKLVSYLIMFKNDLPVGMIAEYPYIKGIAESGWWMAYFIVGTVAPLGFVYLGGIIKKKMKIIINKNG